MEFPLIFTKFKAGLEQGKLLGLKCKDCGKLVLPASIVCPQCGKSDWEIRSFLTAGVIRTFTIIRVAAEGFTPPFIVAMVELDDGPWVMGNVEGVDPDIRDLSLIGQRVKIASRKVSADPFSGGEGVALTFTMSER